MKEKASLPSKRAEKVLAALHSQRLEKERVLQESLQQADKQRQKRLEEASLAAGKHFQQVIEKVRQIKEKERLYAEEKMREYHLRQEAAVEARRKLSESNVANHSLLTSALAAKNKSKTTEDVDNNKKTTPRRKMGASKLSFEHAVCQLYESGIPRTIPKEAKNSLQNSVSELSESLSSMDSGKAPVPMLHQVSVAMDGDESDTSMLFDDFAELIVNPKVIQCVQRILFEVQSVHDRRIGSKSQQSRYPSRVFLASYMIANYPEVVLSGVGAQETKLTESAINMMTAFDDMIRDSTYQEDIKLTSIAVEAFDSMWMLYHDQFRIWKSHDAAGLEADMIKAAVELELSRLTKLIQATERVRHQVDIEALSQAVDHDLQLIEERIATLTGDSGVVRLKAALEAIKSELKDAEESSEKSSKSTPSQSSPVKKMQRRSNDSDSSESGATQQKPVHEWDNLSLIWNLLYDSNWRLPTKALEMQWDDATGKAIAMDMSEDDADRIQFMLMAERNKWNEIENRLMDESTADKLTIVTQIIREVLDKLKSFAPTLVSEQFSKQFDSYASLDISLSPKAPRKSPLEWIDVERCLDIIEWCSGLVTQLCAPSRDEDIAQARRLLSSQAKEAFGDKDRMYSVTKFLVRSIRILKLQTSILSMDVANAHLQALTSRFSRLTPPLRVSYARKKLGDELGLTEDSLQGDFDQTLKGNLPKTRGWLAIASGKLPRLSTFNSKLMTHNSALSHAKQTFPKMKTGFDPSKRYQNIDSQSETISLEKIDSLASWRGLVRVGLVHVISGDSVIGSLSLPETLNRDLQRLHDIKNEFQKCMVMAMCMIIIENHAECGAESMQIQKNAAKVRIQAILRDPNVCLKDISLEVCSCIQSLSPKVESFDDFSSHILNILKSLLHRSSQEGRGITEHLNDILLRLLTIPDTHEQYESSLRDISNHCKQIGAPEIAQEMVHLGKSVGMLAAVTEAVCAPWYEHLAGEFLEEHTGKH